MDAMFYTLMILFIFVCLFLILLILIQKGRGGGLASAFGGAGGNTAFGSKTGDVLTWATSIVFGVFLLLAIGLNLLANSINARVVATPIGANTATTESTMDLPEGQPQVPPATGLPPGVSGDNAAPAERAPDGPTNLSDAPGPAPAAAPANAPVEAAPAPTTQPK
jgi:preprotein translocase subunit SecG